MYYYFLTKIQQVDPSGQSVASEYVKTGEQEASGGRHAPPRFWHLVSFTETENKKIYYK